jgi:2'-5' RNA ligase
MADTFQRDSGTATCSPERRRPERPARGVFLRRQGKLCVLAAQLADHTTDGDKRMRDFFAGIAGRRAEGQEHLHWHILPGAQITAGQLHAPYWPLTSQPGLARVRPQWMHITIQHVAPLQQLRDSEVSRIAGLVRRHCARLAPFELTAGPAQARDAGVVCPLRPGSPARQLCHLCVRASRQVTGGRFEIRPAVYHPHLALAYAIGDVDDDQVREWLCDSQAGDVVLPVTALSLVAQKHDRRQITWRLLDEIPLAGTTQP